MKELKPKIKGSKKGLIALYMAIIALTLCATGCAIQSPRIDWPLPPVPDCRVLDELDAHGLTPEAAPHTWAFLGKVFMYYDVVGAME